MTGIEARVAEARLLWDGGHREGGLLLVLCALAARARRDFPRYRFRDGDAFERFFRSCLAPRLPVEFRGEQWPIERFFYTWMRCELVHDGALPSDLGFDEAATAGELSVRAGGAPDFTLLLSPAWFDQLIAWASR